MKVTVDPWDPSYGTATGEAAESDNVLDLAAERPVGDWGPLDPPTGAAPAVVTFVDGVRRVDARVWVESDGGGDPEPGVCASWAAGAVVCDGQARVVAVEVGRCLASPSEAAVDLATAHGTYRRVRARSGAPEHLWLAVHQRMGAAEVAVSDLARAEAPGLLVVDGPLRERRRLDDAVGLVKSHHVHYLPPELRPLLGRLAPGQRTPLFTLGGPMARHSWYLRLPGGQGGPMAGIVRCECSADLDVARSVALAGATAAVLPRYASEPHKDPRAPQNLFPVAGLERELRRRLGDARLLYRALRAAA